MNRRYVPVLTIAGFDCSGGAGLQADIKTISALGGYATSVVTAVTVQNTVGVQSVYPIPASVVEAQLEAVLSDIHPLAIKIGMVNDVEVVKAIARCLRKYRPQWVVLDPVMFSTSGHSLISDEAREALVRELIPLATLITPNLPEAQMLGDAPANAVCTHYTALQMMQLVHSLQTLGCAAVLLKGGHLEQAILQDVLVTAQDTFIFESPRVQTLNTHGTGCTLSSAIATGLASGLSLKAAVDKAEKYLHEALASGSHIHVGEGHGPVDFFYAPTPSIKQTILL